MDRIPRQALPTPDSLSPDRLRQLGTRIKDLRSEKGWSQRALARRLGLSYSRMSRIEHGRATPSLSLVLGIAETLNARVEELFGPLAGDEALAHDIEQLAVLASCPHQEVLVRILRRLAGLEAKESAPSVVAAHAMETTS